MWQENKMTPTLGEQKNQKYKPIHSTTYVFEIDFSYEFYSASNVTELLARGENGSLNFQFNH